MLKLCFMQDLHCSGLSFGIFRLVKFFGSLTICDFWKIVFVQEVKELKYDIQLLKGLCHDRIIRYFGSHDNGQILSIFMEYITGVSNLNSIKTVVTAGICLLMPFYFVFAYKYVFIALHRHIGKGTPLIRRSNHLLLSVLMVRRRILSYETYNTVEAFLIVDVLVVDVIISGVCGRAQWLIRFVNMVPWQRTSVAVTFDRFWKDSSIFTVLRLSIETLKVIYIFPMTVSSYCQFSLFFHSLGYTFHTLSACSVWLHDNLGYWLEQCDLWGARVLVHLFKELIC